MPSGSAPDFALLVQRLIEDETALCEEILVAVGDSVPPDVRDLVVRECRPHMYRLLPLFLRSMRDGTRVGAHDLAAVAEASRRRESIDVPASVSLAAIRGAIARFGSIVTERAGAGRSRALARVLSHAAVFSHDVARAVIAGRRGAARPTSPPAWVREVTPTQRVMLTLAAQGRSTAEIAAHTHYSEKAVDYHFSRLRASAGAPNRAALVARAVHHELVEP